MEVVAGIDVGGTFTDLLLRLADGTVRHAKVPTTSPNQADGVFTAIAAAGMTPDAIDRIVHGTTATTNALLERKLPRVGLITTVGFRDVLELGRRTRPRPYGMLGSFVPLIERPNRREVAERIGADGSIVTPLDEAAVAREVVVLRDAGCEALVVHFLHSYANPAHERRAGAIARDLWPNDYVTLGHALLSEFREYERGTTAAVNAAVQPVLDRYLGRLARELATRGHRAELLLMNGNGGTVAASRATAEAAKTVMSGPASGVIAAAETLRQAGIANAITCDMGGTSTDVALIAGGSPEISAEISLAYGLPIHLPMVDVRTIGAGGGSIARVDRGGMLRVGPESAGSSPGPIGFGRGGTLPTVTDANLLLGKLDATRLFGGGGGSPRAVRDAFARLGEPLRLDAEATAAAVLRLANVHMTGAIRMVSLARGLDPRDFVLFAFGGAGPLHAVALAREIGIPEVIVPARPGLTNALGCLVADPRHDVVETLNRPLASLAEGEVGRVLGAQAARGVAAIGGGATIVTHVADMQFRGQTHLLRVSLPDADVSVTALQTLFDDAYFRRFRVRLPEMRAMLVNLATTVTVRRMPFPLESLLAGPRELRRARVGRTRLYADQRWYDATVWQREWLPEAARIEGPAIIRQDDATTVLEPGSSAVVDTIGNLRIRVHA